MQSLYVCTCLAIHPLMSIITVHMQLPCHVMIKTVGDTVVHLWDE